MGKVTRNKQFTFDSFYFTDEWKICTTFNKYLYFEGGSLWIKTVTWKKIPMILPRLMKKLFFIFVAHYLKIKSELELLFAVFQLNLIKFNSKWAVLASVEKMQCMIYQISKQKLHLLLIGKHLQSVHSYIILKSIVRNWNRVDFKERIVRESQKEYRNLFLFSAQFWFKLTLQ